MPGYEYKVVPAPTKGQKAKGVKTPEGRFAQALQGVLNVEGAAGWEYLRAELLPSDERSGLTGSTTNWRNVLVFRREIVAAPAVSPPEPADQAPAPRVVPEIEHIPPAEPAPKPVQIAETRKAENLMAVSGMFAAQQLRDTDESPEDEALASDEAPVDKA